MRWPNGGPPKLWVVVVNRDRMDTKGFRVDGGDVICFDRHEKRKAWLIEHYPTYSSADVTLLKYVQKEKK